MKSCTILACQHGMRTITALKLHISTRSYISTANGRAISPSSSTESFLKVMDRRANPNQLRGTSRDERLRSPGANVNSGNSTDNQMSSGMKVDQRPPEAQVDLTGLDPFFLSQFMTAPSPNSAGPSRSGPGSGQISSRAIQQMQEMGMFTPNPGVIHRQHSAHLHEMLAMNQHAQSQYLTPMAINASAVGQMHVRGDVRHGDSLYGQNWQGTSSTSNVEQGYPQMGSPTTTDGDNEGIGIVEDKRRRNTAASGK